jgi:hypothetical protein
MVVIGRVGLPSTDKLVMVRRILQQARTQGIDDRKLTNRAMVVRFESFNRTSHNFVVYESIIAAQYPDPHHERRRRSHGDPKG